MLVKGLDDALAAGVQVSTLSEAETTTEIQTMLEASGAQLPSTHVSELGIVSLEELFKLQNVEHQWVLEGLLISGGLSLLCGKPKAGKSTLARNIALAVSTGRDSLGRETRQGPVLYLALEEKGEEVKRHFELMGATGQEPIFVSTSRAPEDALAELYRESAKRKFELVIIDPLFSLVRVADGNSYTQVKAQTDLLMEFARQTGSHVLCVHHMKKSGDGGEAILGSQALFAAVDAAVLLNRDRDRKQSVVSSIQRYGVDLPETYLALDELTRTFTISGLKEEVEKDHVEDSILEFLGGLDAPVSEADLDEGVRGKKQKKVLALRNLVHSGQVLRTGKGGKSDPFKYALKPNTADSVPCSQVPPPFSSELESKFAGMRSPHF